MSAVCTLNCNYCGDEIEDLEDAEIVTLGETDIKIYFHKECIITFLEEAADL